MARQTFLQINILYLHFFLPKASFQFEPTLRIFDTLSLSLLHNPLTICCEINVIFNKFFKLYDQTVTPFILSNYTVSFNSNY